MASSSLRTYRAKRDFAATAEPQGEDARAPGAMFVVQKHAAHRAGLHWDFRLEHNGVLWSWAVPKGPSLDPADRRMAIHVEDHPVEYADFQGTIAAGEYGGGTVETWDRGIWEPIGDPDAGMAKGDIKFVLKGKRLNGRFTLVRLRNRDRRKAEAWFLIKGHDEAEQTGGIAPVLEQKTPLEQKAPAPKPKRKTGAKRAGTPPLDGAKRGAPPADQAPQLCRLVAKAPDGDGWVSEIKFDGYRLLAWKTSDAVRLVTRNGLDWTNRLPAVAKAITALDCETALLDGELVALRKDGVSSFPDLQAALSAGRDGRLNFFAFDLLALDGWDLRACRLIDRKGLLEGLDGWTGLLRYSAHVVGNAPAMQRKAVEMHLEGTVCKKAGAPYRAGRGTAWVKIKSVGREELIVLGWTPPAGSRTGIGALHVGYFDPDGTLQYAGGVGTGFSERELTALRKRLDALKAGPPDGLLVAGDKLDAAIQWVRPDLVAEIQYAAWSGAGRVRHAVYLGLREDKPAREVVRPVADPDAARTAFAPGAGSAHHRRKIAVPPVAQAARIVVAKAPKRAEETMGAVTLTHPDRPLWPGITKRDLADYWTIVAPHALPGLAHRPLSVVRCPDGIDGQHFFQKNGHGHLPAPIREGSVSGQPYLAIDDVDGLVALTQMSAIELHPWGAPEADPLHPDRLVFDLDPGEGVKFATVVAAAREVRERLKRLDLASFCRTTGGKGLHVVVPLAPEADWNQAKQFCHAFAETMAQDAPEHYVAHVKIADRKGKILVDWLRNGLGATAVSSFCPRARPGAGVATPLAWNEVTAKLDPASHTVLTVPARLAKLKSDPWAGFEDVRQSLPDLKGPAEPAKPRTGGSIVVARKPKPRAKRVET
jgi:bifunctional non-homologous end joining protein LigD